MKTDLELIQEVEAEERKTAIIARADYRKTAINRALQTRDNTAHMPGPRRSNEEVIQRVDSSTMVNYDKRVLKDLEALRANRVKGTTADNGAAGGMPNFGDTLKPGVLPQPGEKTIDAIVNKSVKTVMESPDMAGDSPLSSTPKNSPVNEGREENIMSDSMDQSGNNLARALGLKVGVSADDFIKANVNIDPANKPAMTAEQIAAQEEDKGAALDIAYRVKQGEHEQAVRMTKAIIALRSGQGKEKEFSATLHETLGKELQEHEYTAFLFTTID